MLTQGTAHVLRLNVISTNGRNLACNSNSNQQEVASATAAREISPVGRNDGIRKR